MVTTNGQPATSPADALLTRKLRLMDQASCAVLFTEWDRMEEQIGRLIHDEADLVQTVAAAKAAVEEAKQFAGLDIEGKNEAERTAKRTIALRADVGYQEAMANLRMAEADLARTSADLDVLKRRVRRTERRIEQNIAVLGVLKG